jgi:hypothetical protein
VPRRNLLDSRRITGEPRRNLLGSRRITGEPRRNLLGSRSITGEPRRILLEPRNGALAVGIPSCRSFGPWRERKNRSVCGDCRSGSALH